MPIRIYLDESEGGEPYIAAGWAFPSQRWDDVSDKWGAVLNKTPKISYFKLNEALGFKGQFEGWSEPARDAKIAALMDTLPHEPGFFGHGCYVAKIRF